MVWPTLLAAVVYGCEPGAVVLVLFAGIQWLLHERYRRRVVFLPSFSRARTGSSNVRNGSSARPRGEPSTVDAPMPQPSSLSPAPKPPPAGQGSGVSRQGSSAK
jgi:hypothetical protein